MNKISSKYEDAIYDGRWKCISRSKKSGCIFKNIYNNREITIPYDNARGIIYHRSSITNYIRLHLIPHASKKCRAMSQIIYAIQMNTKIF